MTFHASVSGARPRSLRTGSRVMAQTTFPGKPQNGSGRSGPRWRGAMARAIEPLPPGEARAPFPSFASAILVLLWLQTGWRSRWRECPPASPRGVSVPTPCGGWGARRPPILASSFAAAATCGLLPTRRPSRPGVAGGRQG
jgi:hypothetical protein